MKWNDLNIIPGIESRKNKPIRIRGPSFEILFKYPSKITQDTPNILKYFKYLAQQKSI